jgi:multiple sugar transport system ATP-binding protein
VTTALGEAQLPDRCRQAVERSKSSGNVILGIRPEHFEDAALVGDKPGGTFDAPVDIVEAMGSDVYAYFVMKGEEAHSAELDELAADAGNDLHADGVPITARLDAASHVRRGKTARLWYDTSKVAVFDADTGANLAPGDDDVDVSSSASSSESGGAHRA